MIIIFATLQIIKPYMRTYVPTYIEKEFTSLVGSTHMPRFYRMKTVYILQEKRAWKSLPSARTSFKEILKK